MRAPPRTLEEIVNHIIGFRIGSRPLPEAKVRLQLNRYLAVAGRDAVDWHAVRQAAADLVYGLVKAGELDGAVMKVGKGKRKRLCAKLSKLRERFEIATA
jgi:hypothetical protein